MTLLKLRCFPKTFITCSNYSRDIFSRTSFLRTSLFDYLFHRKLFFMIWIIWYFNICNFFCSGSQVFDHVGVLKNYLKFTGKHGCWNLLLIELQASYFQSATFIKKNTSKIPVLGVFADLSSSIFYTLCYK